MTSRQTAQYYRLGLFVMIGAAALVAVILVFGARNLFTKTITAETYIKESVQGLDVGAPVRFRGVRIGQISLSASPALFTKRRFRPRNANSMSLSVCNWIWAIAAESLTTIIWKTRPRWLARANPWSGYYRR